MAVLRISDLPNKLMVKCRFKSGGTADLEVLDISPGGCLVGCRGWSAEAGSRALVQLPGLASQPVEVVWVEDQKAGLAFEQPLHEAVLENLWARLSAGAA